MNGEKVKIFEDLDGIQINGRICSEVYSCVEDIYYFINLSPPFAN